MKKIDMIYCVILLSLIPFVSAYTDGIGACTTAASGYHGNNAQSGSGGYTLNSLPASYSSSTPITFTLTGTSSFRGFLVYAADLTNKNVGTWTAGSGQKITSPYVTCGSFVSHSSSSSRTTTTLTWTPPSPPVTVQFKAVVVKSGATWYNLPATTVTGSGGGGGCSPITNCALSGASCGTLFDGCQNLTCGTCTSPATCVNKVCTVAGCTPTTNCVTAGQSCGTLNNGCTTINCGTCSGTDICDTTSGSCGPPIPPEVNTPSNLVTPANPDQLPTWVGIAVGIGCGFIIIGVIVVVVLVYLAQRKKQAAAPPTSLPSNTVDVDVEKHFPPPGWRRTIKRMTNIFSKNHVDEYIKQESSNSIRVEDPPKSATRKLPPQPTNNNSSSSYNTGPKLPPRRNQ